MSKILIDEATVKLALDYLNWLIRGLKMDDKSHAHQVAAALREALEEPDFWEGYVPEPDNTCNNALRAQGKAYPRTCKKCGLGPCVELAQQALDKKAQNARELGLDYEPVCNKDPQGCWNVRCQLGKKCKNTPAQQEPVAKDNSNYRLDQPGLDPLYTSPPAQRTWVGLTDEDIDYLCELAYENDEELILTVQAKLKEKNT